MYFLKYALLIMGTAKIEDDKNLPKATVDKLIHDILPDGYTINKNTRNLMREASLKFLNIIALDANKICEIEKKKTIMNQHVYKSLGSYGFESYIDSCKNAASDYDDYSKHKPSRQNKFKESGKTLDELHEDQMRLFDQAKKQIDIMYDVSEIADQGEEKISQP